MTSVYITPNLKHYDFDNLKDLFLQLGYDVVTNYFYGQHYVIGQSHYRHLKLCESGHRVIQESELHDFITSRHGLSIRAQLEIIRPELVADHVGLNTREGDKVRMLSDQWNDLDEAGKDALGVYVKTVMELRDPSTMRAFADLNEFANRINALAREYAFTPFVSRSPVWVDDHGQAFDAKGVSQGSYDHTKHYILKRTTKPLHKPFDPWLLPTGTLIRADGIGYRGNRSSYLYRVEKLIKPRYGNYTVDFIVEATPLDANHQPMPVPRDTFNIAWVDEILARGEGQVTLERQKTLKHVPVLKRYGSKALVKDAAGYVIEYLEGVYGDSQGNITGELIRHALERNPYFLKHVTFKGDDIPSHLLDPHGFWYGNEITLYEVDLPKLKRWARQNHNRMKLKARILDAMHREGELLYGYFDSNDFYLD